MRELRFLDHSVYQIHENLFEIQQTRQMQSPARIYASEAMFNDLLNEAEPLKQVINVAHLPGIQKYSLAMPDIHWGYGFPIGGVAATDWNDGVISPGGVGYDINCGVRLASTGLQQSDIQNKLAKLTQELFKAIPTGVGSSHAIRKLNKNELKSALKQGVSWFINQGYGKSEDIEHTEEKGFLSWADPSIISERALERGQNQMGTLGSGNHFLEIDVVDKIYDPVAAEVMDIFEKQILLLIHTGSRGFGYQVCDDSLRVMSKAAQKYKISLPDRQLASAPIQSTEGQNYLAAMAAAANFAWSNRQVIMHLANRVMKRVLSISESELDFKLIYDVSHNIAKKENHQIEGKQKTVCVHRKGATRALPPGSSDIPRKYKSIGQPVLIPGDMGRYSFVCTGTNKALDETFGSACHGAGRLLSRTQAKRAAKNRDLFKEMSKQGIVVQAKGKGTMAEEMPEAYKDVTNVVNIMHDSGICNKVARLKPLGVIKG
ncbi:MAG: RtcB family protein [Calditrichaceae bacterium]